jgi:hypothetical protein
MIDNVSQEQNKNTAKTITGASCYYYITANESKEISSYYPTDDDEQQNSYHQ